MTLQNKLAIFITATDTGVGKTTITAALILALKHKGHEVGIMKPVETGINPEQLGQSDTDRLRNLLSPPPPFDAICLYAFPQPLAPITCAQEAGRTIEISRIVSSFHTLLQQYKYFIVEGAGGVLTPLTHTQTMREIMITLNLPVLIIARTSLGGVNHLLLTLEALQSAGITRCDVVLNESVSMAETDSTRQQRGSTIKLIRELSTVPVYGPVEFQEGLQINWRKGVETLAEHPEIQRLADHLIERMP